MEDSCAPIRDLLPLYAEGKAAPETRAFIERHLSECLECHACETRCPFNVSISERMKKAKELFEE